MSVDNKTGQEIAIDFVHHKVHDKEFYRVSHVFTNTAASVASEILIVGTSTCECHMLIAATAFGGAEAQLLKSVTYATTGTNIIVAQNYHSDGADTTTAKFYYTPTSATGTVWHYQYMPGGGRKNPVGSEARSDGEFILEDDDFLLRVWNYADTVSTVQITLDFYELPE